MSADKPEAGRSCCDLHRMTVKDDNRCLWILPNGDATDVSPAPRPVEPTVDIGCYCSDFNSAGMPCQPGTCPNRPAPRPVERCSCEESVALRKALKGLIADIRVARAWANSPSSEDPCPPLASFEFDDLDYLERIARRALALGGETET